MKSKIVSVKPDLLPMYLNTIVQRSLITPGLLKSGRPYKQIGLTPREIVGAFLVCAVGQYLDPDNVWTIGSDPEEQDGVICCVKGVKEGDCIALEQVFIPSFSDGDLTTLVQERINNKQSKGVEYSRDRHLVVFCSKTAKLNLDKITQYLLGNTQYLSYWIIARSDLEKWEYIVATPYTSGDPRLIYKVMINDDFSGWKTEVFGRLKE